MKNLKLFIIINLFIISCGSNNEWSSEVKRNFLDGCVEEARIYAEESSAYSYCNCALVEIQKIYDEESFNKEETKMIMGMPTSEKFNNHMADIVIKCSDRLKEK